MNGSGQARAGKPGAAPTGAALFLDRDGVLVHDVGLVTRAEQLLFPPDVPAALRRASQLGLALVVITNQTVVARGLCSEAQLDALHEELERALTSRGAPRLRGIYVCPHHPHAQVERYRVACECRKPRPGLLLRAARELGLDLSQSFLLGDRPSDVAAGRACGVTPVLLAGPESTAQPIVGAEALGALGEPAAVVASASAALDWIEETLAARDPFAARGRAETRPERSA
jgi:D-glycero-D-manno-heptose 1,7-bisphosphate phosphatase